MESQETRIEIFEKFTWKIDNFSHLNVNKRYSECFVLGGYPWTIILLPKGNLCGRDNSLSIYLEAVQTANMSEGWSRYVKFKLLVFNQLKTLRTITKETCHEFNAKESDWGFTSFMTLTELLDSKRGFIVRDTCIVGAEVFVRKSSHEKPVNQTVNLTASLASGSQTEHMEVEDLRPEPESTNMETLSSASKDPEVELVSAAMGRVIYFLKTKKVQDMNEQACKELQVLWDELKKFQFDFTWLEPQVQTALGLKNYVEKALQVEKLKENKVVLELEMEKLNAKLAAAEVSLDVERDLLKAQGIKEKDLDSVLGSGSWRP